MHHISALHYGFILLEGTIHPRRIDQRIYKHVYTQDAHTWDCVSV